MISLSADRVKGCNIASLVAAVWSAVVSKGCRAASLFASESAFLRKKVIIIIHYSLLITNLFMLSCSSSSDSEEPTPYDGPSVLDIYVYAPGQAVPTRANLGEVDADEAENAIHTLQIWVFTHDVDPEKDGKLVTYFKTTAFMASSEEGAKFELPIPDDFVDASPRPSVDVYVLANVTLLNCGLSFDENTERDDLEDAVLKYDSGAGTDFFGLTSPITEVPFEGLPMSGVLRNQPVTGSRPILTLGTSSENMAKVKLARAVSRIRFVFSCSSDFDGLKITDVTIDEGKIPDEEYLFLTDEKNPYGYKDNDFHIGTNYNIVDNEHPAPSLFTLDATAICDDPAYYAWDRLVNDEKAKDPTISDQALAEAYEALIDDGVQTIHEGETKPRLTEQCLYLRESDQRLSGTIKYKVKGKNDDDYGDELSTTFSMVAPETPAPWEPFFSRNHTWTVYAYLAWAKMNIVAIHINKWETSNPGDYTVYNW